MLFLEAVSWEEVVSSSSPASCEDTGMAQVGL